MIARITIAMVFCLTLTSLGVAELSESEVIALYRQAQAWNAAGKYDSAARAYRQILPDTARIWGEGSFQHTGILLALATLYSETGRLAQAEPLFRQCLGLRETRMGKNHPHVANVLNNYALMLANNHRPHQAEPLYVRALAIYEKNDEEVRIADVLNNLGNLYLGTGRPEQAEPLVTRGLRMRENRIPRDIEDLGDSVLSLGNVYFDTGREEKAIDLYARAARLFAEVDADHPKRAAALNNQAAVLVDLGKLAEAEPLYERSLKIRMTLGADHPQVGDSLNNLALLHLKLGKHAQAEEEYRRALEISEKHQGKDHPSTGQTLVNLAAVYQASRRSREAIDAVRRGATILETTLGKEHPEVAHALHELARMEQQAGNGADAQAAAKRARRATHRYVTRILPTLGEREQVRFLRARDAERLHQVLSLAFQQPGDDERVTASAAWLLNARGLIHQARAQTLLALRDAGDPRLGDASRELLDVRRQLAQWTLQGPAGGDEAEHRRKVADLTQKEQDLSTQLQHQGASTALPPWVELRQVQKALLPGSVLLDYLRLEVYDFAAGKTGEARYVVWITTREGTPRLVDLGPAREIDSLVEQTRKILEEAPARLKEKGEIEAERLVREPLGRLAQRLVQPLPEEVKKAGRWVISPDAGLWLLPWAALPLDEKNVLVERHAVQLVISGRDLLPREAVPGMPAAATLFANPDFDAPNPQPVGTLRGLSGDLHLGRIRSLPGTAVEVEVLAEKLAKLHGQAPRVLTEKDATCAAFFRLRQPRLLGLATHGYFLPNPTGGAGRSEDPLLRCGLLLAGCNKPGEAGRSGVLTGREVLSVDLRGCELVILSACETGLGDVRQGEGVAGLRQAFQLAGAEGTLSTLWRVPDDETALQMAGFMTGLEQGKDRVEALAQAQRQRISARRDRFGAAHPLNWAGFTFTGSAGSTH